MICDNQAYCHNPIIIGEDKNAIRVACDHCWAMAIIRKHPVKNVPENRQYSKFFKKDILQGDDNLFYKYHSELLNT